MGMVQRTVGKLRARSEQTHDMQCKLRARSEQTHDMQCARTVRWNCRSRMGMVQRTISKLARTDDLMTCNVPGP